MLMTTLKSNDAIEFYLVQDLCAVLTPDPGRGYEHGDKIFRQEIRCFGADAGVYRQASFAAFETMRTLRHGDVSAFGNREG